MLEVCSVWGYIMLFRGVFARGVPRIDWRASYEITMAGLAATRLFAAGVPVAGVDVGRADARPVPFRQVSALFPRPETVMRDRRPGALVDAVPL